MKRLYRGIFSFMLMVSCALQLGAQDTRIVTADEIPSSLRDAEAVKLTGTWETSNFSELKMALGTNGIGASNWPRLTSVKLLLRTGPHCM